MGVEQTTRIKKSLLPQRSIEERIKDVVDLVRPMIVGHGGNVEFAKFENDIVYVKLIGACTQCPFSLYTLKLGIEERLKEQIPHIQRVELVEEN